jgi:glycolate oxidase iron-sulfur subunit
MEFRELPPVKEQLMKCVRCGKCRELCPVFAEIGIESAAPRGHVFMVQMLRDGKVEPSPEVYERLGQCLMCETCSANCPSGIAVHELNAAARAYLSEKNPSRGKDLIFEHFWTKPEMMKHSIKLASLAQRLGLQKLARNVGLTRLLPGDLKDAEKILDNIPLRSARSQLPGYTPAVGTSKYRVGYFLGCGTDFLNPEIAQATVEVLSRNGCEVVIPQGLKCCGLPHMANGKLDVTRQLTVHNIKLFDSLNVDYIITDCGSCSATLSQKNLEFVLAGTPHQAEGQAFAAKVMDLTVFLIDVLDIQMDFETDQKWRVTYHDPCHLVNAQGITEQPRELLRRIPGVELVEMPHAASCCGGSGTYSVTHHQVSMQILDKKMANAISTGAEIIATCCPSCIMQLSFGCKRNDWDAEVVHPVVLLQRAYKKALTTA